MKRRGHLPLKQMSPVNAIEKSVPCKGVTGWTSVGMAYVSAGTALRVFLKCELRRAALFGRSGWFLAAGRSVQQGI